MSTAARSWIASSDNFLRPRLVGRDTRMADLLILLSTLGGLFLFGPMGFIVGPIVAPCSSRHGTSTERRSGIGSRG